MTARLLLAVVSILAVSAEAHAQMMMRVHARVIEKAAVRIEPSLTRTPLTTLAPGTVVTVLGIDGDWLNVEFEDERYGRRFGYMPRRSVNLPSAASPRPAARSTTTPTPTAAARAGAPTNVVASNAAEDASPRSTAATSPVPAPASPKPAASSVPAPASPKPADNPIPEPASPTPATAVLFPAPAKREPPSPKPLAAGVFPEPASPKPAATEPRPAPARGKSAAAGGTSESSTRPIEPTRSVELARTSAATLEPLGNPAPREAPAAVRPPAEAVSPVPLEAGAPSPREPVSAALVPAREARVGRDPVTPTKGMPVTLMIPRALLKEDGYTPGLRRVPIFAADIDSPTGKPLSVNGRADWMLAGLPSMVEASVEKVNRTKDYTELELRGKDLAVKLRFAVAVADPEQTLGQLVAEGGRDAEAAAQYRKEAHAALARDFFPRDLGDLGDERKLALLAALQSASGSPDIHLRDNQLYASFDLGSDSKVYDDLNFDQAFIVAHVLSESLIPRIRALSKSLPEAPELSGVRVLYRIPHKHQKRVAPEEYRLEIVASSQHLASLSRSEITGQEFLDASALTVDGKSARVSLAAARR